MGLLKIIKKTKAKEKELRLLILGLDNAGKTTILKKFLGEDTSEIAPTLGFQIKTIEHNNFKLNIWDVGGQTTIRSYWRNYFEQTDALIWVVDSGDKLRLEDCRAELQKLLQQEKLAGATLLVFCNKQDIAGALTTKEIRDVLELDKIDGRHWSIFPCSAMTGDGLLDERSLLNEDIIKAPAKKNTRQASLFLVEGLQQHSSLTAIDMTTTLGDDTNSFSQQNINTTTNSKLSVHQQQHYQPVTGKERQIQRAKNDNNSSFSSNTSAAAKAAAAHQEKMEEVKQIFAAIVSFDLTKLTNILQDLEIRKSLEIVNLFDEAGYTVLHSAAYYNSYKIAEYLISYLRRRLAQYLKQKYLQKQGFNKNEDLDKDTTEQIKQRVRNTIKEWVNLQSIGEEGFYPLHFASFHGNVKLIKLLVKCGANIYAKNKQGINMMHVAAQGDQAYSLTYFKQLGLPLQDMDGESSTPLHWACFAGSDTAIYYLLAWGLDVNSQDNTGNTALHLAIKSSENFPNTRAIKELLIKGAQRSIMDYQGKKPTDLIEEITNQQLKNELQMLLQKKKTYCGLSQVKQPLMKLEKNMKTLSVQVFLMFSTFLAMLVNVFPYIPSDNLVLTIITLFTLANVLFVLTWKRDPGYLQKSQKISFLRLVEKFDPNMLCPTCEVICSSESRHCYICNRCVDRFDHHCQWVNNCVGLRNHSVFYMYILCMEFYMAFVVIVSFMYIDTTFTEKFVSERQSQSLIPIYISGSLTTTKTLFYLSLIITMCISTFFLIPLSLLVFVQTQNFLYNQTTNKRFGRYKRPHANEQLIAKVGELKDSDDEADEFRNTDLSTKECGPNSDRLTRNNESGQLKIEINNQYSHGQEAHILQRRSFIGYMRNCFKMCSGSRENRNDLYYQYQTTKQTEGTDVFDRNSSSSQGSKFTKIFFDNEENKTEDLDRQRFPQKNRELNMHKKENKINTTVLDPDLQKLEEHGQRLKVKYLLDLLSKEKIDLNQLRTACVTQYGLVNDEMRKKIWPILLNVDFIMQEAEEQQIINSSRSTNESMTSSTQSTPIKKNANQLPLLRISDETEWRRYIKAHKESIQIQKDIERSLNSFDICKNYGKTTKQLKRDQLNNIIHAVLVKNSDLYYYQGFHDFVSVFLLTLGENMGFYCVEAASRFLIKDYMLESFEPGIIPALNLLMKLLKAVDEDCYEMIQSGGDIPSFSLSWILTWYSHDLISFQQVQRIFDACLSQHPLFALYLTVATIIFNKERLIDIYDEDDPLTSLYMVFQRINPNTYTFDVGQVLNKAIELINQVPPDDLLRLQDKKYIFNNDSPFLNFELPKFYLTNHQEQKKIIENQIKSQRSLKSARLSAISKLSTTTPTSSISGKSRDIAKQNTTTIEKAVTQKPSKIDSIRKVVVQSVFIGLTVALTLYSMSGQTMNESGIDSGL